MDGAAVRLRALDGPAGPARETGAGACATLLDESIETGWSRLGRIGADPATRLHMTIDEVREYLQGFRFRATSAEHEAMAKFCNLDRAMRANAPAPARSG